MRRDDAVDILALQFVLGVVKHPLERRIAEDHAVLLVLGDDAQRAVGNQRVEIHGAFQKLLLGALDRGDVERGREDGGLPLEICARSRKIQPTEFAGLRPDFELVARLGIFSSEPRTVPLLAHGAKFGIHQVPRVHGEQLFPRVAA